MPAFKIAEQTLYCDRDFRLLFSLFDEQGQAVAIASGDVVRAKLALGEGAAPAVDVDSAVALAGGSLVEITTRGDVSDPAPANWTPASGVIHFAPADTKPIPDSWAESKQSLRYVLDLSLSVAADGLLKPFGRGDVVVRRSPGGKGT
jgi:hypothetical protein